MRPHHVSLSDCCLRLPHSSILIHLNLATPNHQIRVDEVPSIRAPVHTPPYTTEIGDVHLNNNFSFTILRPHCRNIAAPLLPSDRVNDLCGNTTTASKQRRA